MEWDDEVEYFVGMWIVWLCRFVNEDIARVSGRCVKGERKPLEVSKTCSLYQKGKHGVQFS